MAAATTLADELLLLSYDEAGSAQGSSFDVDYGLAGALLMELALAERVMIEGQRVVVADPEPIGDELIDDGLARIATDPARKPGDWISTLSGGLRERVLDRLVDAGMLRRERERVLWLFHRVRYPWPDGLEPPIRAQARSRLRAAVDAAGPPDSGDRAAAVDPRTAALGALVRTAGLATMAVPDRPKAEVEAKLKAIADASWALDAVRKAVAEVEMAIMLTTTSATTTVITGR